MAKVTLYPIEVYQLAAVAERLGKSSGEIYKRAAYRERDEKRLAKFSGQDVNKCADQVRELYESALIDFAETAAASNALTVEILDQFLADLLIARTGLNIIQELKEGGVWP